MKSYTIQAFTDNVDNDADKLVMMCWFDVAVKQWRSRQPTKTVIM